MQPSAWSTLGWVPVCRAQLHSSAGQPACEIRSSGHHINSPDTKEGPYDCFKKSQTSFRPHKHTLYLPPQVFLHRAQTQRQLLYQYQEFSPWLNTLPILQFMSLKGKFNMKTPVKVKAESNDVCLFLFCAASTQPLKGKYAIKKKKKATLKFLSSECYFCTS